ncbi:MAG TPA: esterase [Anaerolineales bacterium]|nr:esterase [Anaerolineales bacterium]
MTTKTIHTLKGPIEADSLGLILPHEHLFTDLRGPHVPDYAWGDPSMVVNAVEPYLEEAAAAGVTALVECSTVGVGRNLAVLQRLAEATSIQIVPPTGVYRDAFIPEALRELSENELAELWAKELTEGIEGTSIQAGFIKLAMSDDGPTALEIRNLRAAARASQNTGAVIASHTIGGKIARQELDVLEEAGLDLHRFIWVHAQTEPDIAILKEAARRGAYVELDSVGAPFQSQEDLLETVLSLVESGFAEHLLLSHDAGWYQPGRPGGVPETGYRGYTALTRDFIPLLQERGVSEEQVRLITVNNPARAFAF